MAQHPNGKNWELTPYEIQRHPQQVMADNAEVHISPRSLHSELMCPICLDMLTETLTTKECLHRFCSSCITTALRSGNKECPTCRKKVVSKRSLRRDPNFDALIAKICPNREEYDAFQEEQLQKITKHHNHAALSLSIEEGLRYQALIRTQKMKKSDLQQETTKQRTYGALNNVKKSNSKVDEEGAASSTNGGKRKVDNNSGFSTSSSKHQPSGESAQVHVDLRPHPNQMGTKAELLVRRISTGSHASMNHVSHYLTLRILMEQPDDDKRSLLREQHEQRDPQFTLFIRDSGGSLVKLEYSQTLRSLCDEASKQDDRMQIYYLKK